MFDDGLLKGFVQVKGREICKLYADPWFQSEGIGNQLITFAIREFEADYFVGAGEKM